MRSRRSNTFTLRGSGAPGVPVNFTEPHGLGLIARWVSDGGKTEAPVRRYGLRGALEYTYPTSFPQAGRVDGGALYSPDGTELVIATTGGLEVVGNGGQPIRYLPTNPAGLCQPMRWWSAGVVLVLARLRWSAEH